MFSYMMRSLCVGMRAVIFPSACCQHPSTSILCTVLPKPQLLLCVQYFQNPAKLVLYEEGLRYLMTDRTIACCVLWMENINPEYFCKQQCLELHPGFISRKVFLRPASFPAPLASAEAKPDFWKPAFHRCRCLSPPPSVIGKPHIQQDRGGEQLKSSG